MDCPIVVEFEIDPKLYLRDIWRAKTRGKWPGLVIGLLGCGLCSVLLFIAEPAYAWVVVGSVVTMLSIGAILWRKAAKEVVSPANAKSFSQRKLTIYPDHFTSEHPDGLRSDVPIPTLFARGESDTFIYVFITSTAFQGWPKAAFTTEQLASIGATLEFLPVREIGA